jgi:hypothetical protein
VAIGLLVRLPAPIATSGASQVVALDSAALAVGGALPSLRTWRATASAPPDSAGDGSARFIAGVNLMASLLFALLILVQTSGGFIIPGCAR